MMTERMQAPEKYRVLSGFALKWIAVISMIADHFGSIVMDGVLAPYRQDGLIYFTSGMPRLILLAPRIKEICEILGSVGFPLFCFLIAEGFAHTRDRLKYGLRMGLFALLSEIPFNLAHYGMFFNFKLQNVMFTLCIGIFTLLGVSLVAQRFAACKRARITLTCAVTAAGMALAFLLRSEYVFLGVLTIVLFYLLRNAGLWRPCGVAPLLVVSPWILLAVPPLLLYNGQRGRGSKYFFYVFYPAHFLLFASVARLLAGRAV